MAMPKPRDGWRDMLPAFAVAVVRRLYNGAREYGDRSLEAHPGALLRELEAELEDQSAWAYLNWRRVRKLRRALERAEACPLCGATCKPLEAPRKETVLR